MTDDQLIGKNMPDGLQVDRFIETVINYCHCVIALSGGVDSSVLLHLASTSIAALDGAEKAPKLSAIHINHQLHPNSEKWALHCQQQCDRYRIPLEIVSVAVKDAKGSIENAARQARYAVFEQYLNSKTLLLMAHHADDQAETLLFRLMRGTGIHGAAGMPQFRPLGNGYLYRPFINNTRVEIEHYAQQYGLSHIDDSSNDNIQFDRNFLRHNILPRLKERWPQATAMLTRFSEHARENIELIEQIAKQDLSAVQHLPSRYGESLDIVALKLLSEVRQKNLLRFWLHQRTGISINRLDTLRLLKMISASRSGNLLMIGEKPQENSSDAWFVGVYQHRIYMANQRLIDTAKAISTSLSSAAQHRQQTIVRWGDLAAIKLDHSSTDTKNDRRLHIDNYQIRNRSAGDKVVFNGVNRTLKNLMQELGIPSWLRDVYPVIYCGEKVAAIGDLMVADEFCVKDGWRLSIEWNADQPSND